MNDLMYCWHASTSLSDEISRPLSRISVELTPQGRPMRATLWRTDHTGLRVQSEMHDLGERIEVGVLRFDLVSTPNPDEKSLDLDHSFKQPHIAKKMVITESGSRAESGLLLRSISGSEILIVASSHPYQLAVKGVLSAPHMFEPEYPLERYEFEPFA